jgi:anthranilate phosphoribosyltransferase
VAELAGAADAMRSRVVRVRPPPGVHAIDTCGTGGDGRPTFNISTAAAIVAAAAGATVAKHGNQSYTRPSGSAEVLAAMGIDIHADIATLEACLRDCRIAFLFAQRLHPAMKHAAPIRRALGIRTIFNLLGPLTNPAGVRRQVIGVSRPEHVERVIHALRDLGAERAIVVHGVEGLCDLSIAGPSRVARLDGGRVWIGTVRPESSGIQPGRIEDVFVSSPQESAARITDVLAGRPGPGREITVFNAAAALWAAGICDEWSNGVAAARAAIDSRSAAQTLAAWRAASGVPRADRAEEKRDGAGDDDPD